MELIDGFRNKNIKVTKLPNLGTTLRKQWEDNFAAHMSHKEKKDINLYDDDCSGFLWHLFSYEKRECLEGKEAEQAFNNEPKDTCYIFYQHTDDALILEEISEFNANDLLDEIDIYVADKDFNWTYVKTHETGWYGPYFSRRVAKFN